MTEGRDRFLKAIAERLPVDRIEEVHVFPSIRQGGKESGAAVVAVRPQPEADGTAGLGTRDSALAPEGEIEPQGPQPDDDSWLDTDAPLEKGEHPEANVEEQPSAEQRVPSPAVSRLVVYRARYRLTLKGADRGKWEFDLTEEADAPASTVDEVVRGVHLRAGGDDEPERMSGDAFRAALAEEPWTPTR
jgi:hypothetical protein